MGRENSKRRPLGVSVTGALTLLLLVMCLAEGATEQRINSRGSKATKLIQKVNGWRSQRGGSCLSYGHSCWGAHGKRSGKPPATAPDWFLAKLFRRIDTNGELERPRQNLKNDDIYQGNAPEDTPSNRLDSDEDIPVDPAASRNPEAKPMLDDELLSKIRLWQIMRDVTEDQ